MARLEYKLLEFPSLYPQHVDLQEVTERRAIAHGDLESNLSQRGPQRYAPEANTPWNDFQWSIAVLCGMAFVCVGISTAENQYYLRCGGIDGFFGWPGLIASHLSPFILILAFFTRELVIIVTAACLVLLSIKLTEVFPEGLSQL